MRHTRNFRRTNTDDKKTFKQLILTLAGIICLLLIIFYVGIPLLVKLSGVISGLKKETPQIGSNSEIVIEPVLDILPEATNSARIIVTGNANEGETVSLYLNSRKLEDKIVGKDNMFSFNNVPLENGVNEIYAIANIADKKSTPSKTQKISYINEPPKLEIDSPHDGDKFKRENREITIKGKTDENVSISVNDRFVIVDPDGSFQSLYRLNDGENTLEIKAVDTAGNTQKTSLKVIYEP